MHVPLLKRAKERGIYTITCDYIPENVGHQYADEAYYESTTDIEAVLNLAKSCRVDGVMTFNSDPAALTAAYVSEKLGLPTSGYSAVKVMSEKDLFRDFLADNNFNYPKHKSFSSLDSLLAGVDFFSFPVIIKPVDSSGSKGVNIVENIEDLVLQYEQALTYSRSKRVIVEQYIENVGPQLHGDGFVKDGELVFCALGDHHFNEKINNLVPISTTFPSEHSAESINAVKAEVARFIKLVEFKQGGINIEARINNEGKIFLIEVGPRNGGNFTPIVIQKATNFDFVDSALSLALGEHLEKYNIKNNGIYGYLILHSPVDGFLNSIWLSDELNEIVLEKYIYLNTGDKVNSFRGANSAVGVLLVKFTDLTQKKHILKNFGSLYKIELR